VWFWTNFLLRCQLRFTMILISWLKWLVFSMTAYSNPSAAFKLHSGNLTSKEKHLIMKLKCLIKNAAKHPHAPVVKAVEQSGHSSTSSALLLRDDLIARLHESDLKQQENATAILCELREMRRVSSSLAFPWLVFS